MKETQKTDMSKIELHVEKEDISPDKYEIQHEEVLIITERHTTHVVYF